MSAARQLVELVDEVFRLSEAFVRAGDRIVAEDDLTASRWMTLGAVAHGPLSVAGIARRRGMRRQSASESVTWLEAAGLVTRAPDPTDARAPLVHLTDEGRRTLDRIRPRRVAWAERTAAVATSDELAAVVDLLRRLREALADADSTR